MVAVTVFVTSVWLSGRSMVHVDPIIIEVGGPVGSSTCHLVLSSGGSRLRTTFLSFWATITSGRFGGGDGGVMVASGKWAGAVPELPPTGAPVPGRRLIVISSWALL